MKNSISRIHLDILDKHRQELLNILTKCSNGFILAGGTALALQLGHRISYDFDFFSDREIQPRLSHSLAKNINIKNVAVDSSDELTIFDTEDVKISFIFYYFRLLHEPIELKIGLKICPIKQIAIHKAYAISRRAAYRDYFDLYTLLKNGHVGLKELISESEKTYKELFNTRLFLQQLVYFDDILDFEIIPAHKKAIVEKPNIVKQFLDEQIRQFISEEDLL